MTNETEGFYNSRDIAEALMKLDILCENNGVQAELVVLGGAGIMLAMELKEGYFRKTLDIDVNLVSTNNESDLISLLNRARIDVVGGVMEVPPTEDFRNVDNLYRMNVDFSAIKIYVPSLELLTCGKLFSKREKDLRDLEATDLLSMCDKEKLLSLVQEYKQYMLNPEDKFVNVHELFRILEEKGI